MKKSRPRIGLLVSGLSDSFTVQLCHSLMKALNSYDADLIVIPGKYLDRDLSEYPDIFYEYQFNTLFYYPTKENLDGLIVAAGCIGCLTTEDRVKALLDYYQGIPMVLTAAISEGIPSVIFDNTTGVIEGLEYMLQELGCKHICMIGGPDGNTDAEERKQTYLDFLARHHIEFEDRMYTEGTLSYENSRAFDAILRNNPDMDGLFCANDDTALGFYEYLRERGIEPGEDLKILGFDNTMASAKARPSLSTINTDLNLLGEETVKALFDLLAGKPVPEKITVPTNLIVRGSFNTQLTFGEYNDLDFHVEKNLRRIYDDIFYRYENEAGEEPANIAAHRFCEFLAKIQEGVDDGFSDPTCKDQILDLLDDFLALNMFDYADMDNLLQMATLMRTQLRMNYKGRDVANIHRTFETVYQKFLHAIDRKLAMLSREQNDTIYTMKLFAKKTLEFKRGNDQSYQTILTYVDWLDITSSYIFTFEEPILHFEKEPFTPPDHLLLKAYRKDDKVYGVPHSLQSKKLSELFSIREYGPEKHTFVVMPLFFDETLYGIFVCNLSEKIFADAEFMCNQFGSVMHMIQLLKENEQIRAQLETHLATMKAHNIELDNLSRSDALTGILNRRGFTTAAESALSDLAKAGKSAYVAYVDMNNLKIINDRFGHDDGDFSLKLVSTVLRESLPQEAVLARIGGDEYAFVCTTDVGSAEELEKQIHARFRKLNALSDKPFNVTVSIGIQECTPEDSFSVDAALNLADEKLYLAKQHKDRRVIKMQQ